VKTDVPKAEADGTPYTKPTERAPESWRPATREHWTKLPPEVREEVMKRETEMNQFVQRTSTQRKIADQFIQTVQPYMGMIQSEGGNPLTAVQNLLQTAAFLRTGPSGQKATLVAKLVKDFGISIEDLDRALVGEKVPEAPEDKINQLLEQRLAPVNQLLQQIQGVRQQRSQQVDQEVDTEIQQFAQDPTNEFFRDVYNEMADLVEIAARNGRSLSLKDAYDKSCMMSSSVQEVIRTRNASKKSASSSLAPRGAPAGGASSPDDSVRGDLERAFETLAGR
jgi:DNA-binding transcriptional MerR regulator